MTYNVFGEMELVQCLGLERDTLVLHVFVVVKMDCLEYFVPKI